MQHKEITMAILAMLMFGGAVAQADDKKFRLTLDQAVKLDVRNRRCQVMLMLFWQISPHQSK